MYLYKYMVYTWYIDSIYMVYLIELYLNPIYTLFKPRTKIGRSKEQLRSDI
jgi:hypothetical protein